MSIYTSQPGTRLAGRYRLEDRVSGGDGWARWRAVDEILARAVTVLVLGGEFADTPRVVAVARAASRLTDSRLCRVFDVDNRGDGAYVVTEWATGDTLEDMLAAGPVDATRAVEIVAEAAGALAAVHEAGLTHLHLTPASLRWTGNGGVKIDGLGVDAVLTGSGALRGSVLDGSPMRTGDTALTGDDGADDAADEGTLADTRSLAELLYAAVTGYWPGTGPTSLPPAPTLEGAVCSPRQVSAAVPVGLDSVICRTLFPRHGRDGAAINTPADLTAALAKLKPSAARVVPARGAVAEGGGRPPAGLAGRTSPAAGRSDDTATGDRALGSGRSRGTRARSSRPSVLTTVVVGVLAVLVLAAIGATAWTVTHGGSAGTATGQNTGSGNRHQGQAANSASTVLKPVSVRAFDNPSSAQDALGGNSGSYWQTQYYIGKPVFGGLKKGTGLVLDLGKSVQVGKVTVDFGSQCCATAKIALGNAAAAQALHGAAAESASPPGFTTVASTSHAVGSYTFTASGHARGRYLLVWFTKLPPMAGAANKYQADVYNIVVHAHS